LAEVRPDVPEELSNLVATLLARNPGDRPETAANVADGLARWANPNAKRALVEMIPSIERTDDPDAAARSLVGLVGGEPEESASHLLEKKLAVANGSGRRIGRWLLVLAGFAAAVLGVVMLFDTPEGTLRIESEAANLQVELVDEADRTKTVQIEEGENATRLRAGKYRIRLAGKHDNLSLTPGAIELRRGEERLARISVLPTDVSKTQNAGGGARPDEPGARATNEELTRAVVTIEYEDGRPATGAEVTIRMQGRGMQGEPERPVIVTGKADAQGVAFNRNLPYGKYEITIKVAEGDAAYWSATLDNVLLEFGGSYQQKVVAPAPEKRATVAIQTAFDSAGLKGLPFGKLLGPKGSFGEVIWSPEPGKQDDRFAQFPVLGDGITSAGLFLMISVTRNVKQPRGATLDWQWMRRDDKYSDDLLVTDDGVNDFKELGWDGNIVYGLPKSKYFTNMPDKPGIQYFVFRDSQRADKTLSLELPPGKLECDVRCIFGKANDEVIQALGLKPPAGHEIWLEASLNAESTWVPRAINRSDWSPGKDIYNVLGYKSLSLKPGETQLIRVSSPGPSRTTGKRKTEAK
jgi:hypothetical protein